MVISDPAYARQILLTNVESYSKGILSEILVGAVVLFLFFASIIPPFWKHLGYACKPFRPIINALGHIRASSGTPGQAHK